MPIHNPRQHIELFHLLFLDQLSRKLDKKLYALKGGCNIRFYFKSIRYSEDIDLDIQIIQKETLKKKIRTILTSQTFRQILLSRNIVINKISEPKQTETTQRWKIHLEISGSDIPLLTKIEFSRRNLQAGIDFGAVDLQIIQTYQLSPIMINHYCANTAFSQKINALVNRKQTQARDVFDLYILLSTSTEIITFDEKIISLSTEAKNVALSISFEDFKSQVLSYLPTEYQNQYNSKIIWEKIVMKVIDSIQN